MAYFEDEASYSCGNPFEEADSAEERVYSVLLQTRSPTSATEIADQAECDPKTATKYLQRFAKLGSAPRRGTGGVTQTLFTFSL